MPQDFMEVMKKQVVAMLDSIIFFAPILVREINNLLNVVLEVVE